MLWRWSVCSLHMPHLVACLAGPPLILVCDLVTAWIAAHSLILLTARSDVTVSLTGSILEQECPRSPRHLVIRPRRRRRLWPILDAVYCSYACCPGLLRGAGICQVTKLVPRTTVIHVFQSRGLLARRQATSESRMQPSKTEPCWTVLTKAMNITRSE